MSTEPLLVIKNLKKHFAQRGSFLKRADAVKAVDGIDLTVNSGETIGLVGESGCGKSTFGRCILRLIEPTSGEITFDGKDLLKQDKRAMRRLRQEMQFIFQDPYSSLNPRKSVGSIIGDAFRVHNLHAGAERKRHVDELIQLVGLRTEHSGRFPHEFSGGQRQRIGIARALALNPKLIVADEAVSALDVSIQAQILNLMVQLQRKFNLTYIFISHDLGVVRHISDRVGVMYLGHLVELAPTAELYAAPYHPYTQALLSAIPRPQAGGVKRIVLKGDVPSPSRPPPGCTFHTRCPYRQPLCETDAPASREITPGRMVACHFPLNLPDTAQSRFVGRQGSAPESLLHS